MIGEKDIVAAISRLLKEKYPDIPAHTTNTKEGFTKECFFIEIVNPEVSAMGEDFMETNMSVRVSYFPIGRYTMNRLFEVRKELANLFLMTLRINDDFYITLEDAVSFTFTTAGNLEMLISLHYMEEQDSSTEEDIEMMEELDVSIGEE
jgi:ribosome biogenesis protein Nip4